MTPDPSTTLIEIEVADHVATLWLNREESLNAISGRMAEELAGMARRAAEDPDVWVVVLAARGDRAFCVGADLKERGRLDDAGWLRNRVLMRSMFESLRGMPQPTIASVFGFALGGGFELALSCDLIVSAVDALFGLPEVRVGIVPGGGGTQLLARRVGLARAKELIFTARRIGAQEALDMGIVSRVVDRGGLTAATMELAGEICGSSPVGVREAKRAIDRTFDVSLDEGIDQEDAGWRRAVASEDRREGIAAFNERRPPSWKGR